MDIKQVTVSAALVEEIYQHLIREPYANVAALVAKLHAEVTPQLTPPQQADGTDRSLPADTKE